MTDAQKLKIANNLRPDGRIQLGCIPIGTAIIHDGVKYTFEALIHTATETYCLMRTDAGVEIKLGEHNFIRLA